MMIPFDAINAAALAILPELVSDWFPNGRMKGREWTLGSLNGEPGRSLSINVSTGKWGDFSADLRGGDPISLAAAAFHGGDRISAARALGKKLGFDTNGEIHHSAPATAPPTHKFDDDWTPTDASTAEEPSAAAMRRWENVWRYNAADGTLLGFVVRSDGADGKKIFPLNYGVKAGVEGWHHKHLGTPRPLYGLDRLADRPDAPVLIVEGEKACDAAAALFPEYVAITWQAGTSNVAHTDWSPLDGREILVWPDADIQGYAAAADILKRFPAAHCLNVLDEDVGADAADLMVGDPHDWMSARHTDAMHIIDAIAACRHAGIKMEGKLPTAEWIAANLPTPEEEPPHWEPDDGEYGESGSDTEPTARATTDREGIIPLGHDRGTYYYYSLTGKQVHGITAANHTKNTFASLASVAHFWQRDTRWLNTKNEVKWDQVTDTLMAQCRAVGIFDPERLRGRGAWLDGKHTVLHVGDEIILDGVRHGLLVDDSRHIYEQAARVDMELGNPLFDHEADSFRKLCVAAPWEDPEHMGKLLGGWCVIAPVCGAMPWRPHLWISSEHGNGKAQPHSSKVLTRYGWRPMGCLKAGDWVTTPDNQEARIIKVFPQGVQKIYKLTFSDGRTARATGDHLWKVRVKSVWRLRTTEQMVEDIKIDGTLAKNLAIPVPEPLSLNDKKTNLSLHPYALGVLLGDGHLGKEYGSKHSGEIRITSADPEIFSRVAELVKANNVTLYPTNQALSMRLGSLDKYGREARKMIGDLRLLGTRSDTKFIPEAYLCASINDRVELLKGLMDTDGSIDEKGCLSYCTCSEKLAKDVQNLVRSLGGLARIGTRAPFCTYLGERVEGKPAYNVSIRLRDASIAFHLPRKLARVNPNYQYADSLFAGIARIEPDGHEEASCISIDHPDRLYITDDFVVTHNSWTLDNIIKPIVGPIALQVQSKTTEAGIRQTLGCDARPIIFDEAETQNDKDRERVQLVLDLARQASSEDGAAIIKGSASGKAMQYRIRSCFVFASINVGMSQAADESRTVLLTLKLDSDKDNRTKEFAKLRELHAKVMVPGFAGRLLARTLALLPIIRQNALIFADAIARSGQSRRTGDTYGVLLAGSWSLCSSTLVTPEQADSQVAGVEWVKRAVVKGDTQPEWQKALTTLLQHRTRVINSYGRQEDIPVNELITMAEARDKIGSLEPEDARVALSRVGIIVGMEDYRRVLHISNLSLVCNDVFAKSAWSTSWMNTLLRIHGSHRNPKSVRMAGGMTRYFTIPLEEELEQN